MLSVAAVAVVTALLAGLWAGFGADAAGGADEPHGPVAAAGSSVGGSAVGGGFGAARPAIAVPRPAPSTAVPATTPPATRAAATDPFAPPSGTPSPPAASRRPSVLVLNNSRVTGLAAWAAARLRALGWPVAGVGNRTGRVPVTTLYYGAGQRAAAAALARRWPAIRAIRSGTPGTAAHGMVLIVTRDAAPGGDRR